VSQDDEISSKKSKKSLETGEIEPVSRIRGRPAAKADGDDVVKKSASRARSSAKKDGQSDEKVVKKSPGRPKSVKSTTDNDDKNVVKRFRSVTSKSTQDDDDDDGKKVKSARTKSVERKSTTKSTTKSISPPTDDETDVDAPVLKSPKSKRSPIPPQPIQTTPIPAQSDQLPPLHVASAVAFYFVTSIAAVFANKFLLSGNSKLPSVTVTFIQILFSVIVGYATTVLTKTTPNTTQNVTQDDNSAETHFSKSFFQPCLLTIRAAIIFCFMLCLNNACLAHVHVAFYQVARSWTILLSLLLQWIAYDYYPSKSQLLCCIVVVGGYLLACGGELPWDQLYNEFKEFLYISCLHFKSWAYIIAPYKIKEFDVTNELTAIALNSNAGNGRSLVLGIVSGFFSCVMVAYNAIHAKELQKTSKMTRSELITWINFNSAIILSCYTLFTGELIETLTGPNFFTFQTLFPLFLSCIAGHLVGYATQIQIQYTSPLGHNMSGTAKASVQSILGWYIEPKQLTISTVAGTIITAVGCGFYSLMPQGSYGEA